MELLRNQSWFGAKRVIQRRLLNLGIEVRKFPTRPFRPVPVFHLAVRLLMERCGTEVTFVQVGANDGVFGDPLRRYITRYPWRGILVEPQPDVFKRLASNYLAYGDRLILENLAISGSETEIVLYRAPSDLVTDAVYASSVASGNPNTIAKQLNIPTSRLERIITSALTLDQLLRKHRIGRLQVLQIDVEGYDWQVLRTLDLDSTSPSIIQFESGHLSNADCDSAVDHLSKHGYEIYWGGYQGDVVALKSGELFAEAD
jgi:FkbM family methyltransferase